MMNRNRISYNCIKITAAALAFCILLLGGCAGAGDGMSGPDSSTQAAISLSEPASGSSAQTQPDLSSDSDTPRSDNPIRIGAVYPLSGNNAMVGTNILRGIDFAVEEINEAGGVNGRMLEVIKADTQGDAHIASTQASRLITDDNVEVLLGCHQSASTEALFDLCEQLKVPALTAISTVDALTEQKREYCFRLCPTNSMYTDAVFHYLQDQASQAGKNMETIAVIADQSMIGQEAIKGVEYYAPRYGMTIADEIAYPQGSADLTDEVEELKRTDADAVIAESYASDAILLVQTMEKKQYHPPVMVAKANGFTDPGFLPSLGSSAEGIASVVEWNSDMQKGQDVNARFRQIFGMDMNGHSAESYTAVWVLRSAFEAAGLGKQKDNVSVDEERKAIRDALENLDIRGNFPDGGQIILPYDRISFGNVIVNGRRHYHDNKGAALAIAQIQNGRYRTIWPFSRAD